MILLVIRLFYNIEVTRVTIVFSMQSVSLVLLLTDVHKNKYLSSSEGGDRWTTVPPLAMEYAILLCIYTCNLMINYRPRIRILDQGPLLQTLTLGELWFYH